LESQTLCCTNCETEGAEDRKFCARCGMPLGASATPLSDSPGRLARHHPAHLHRLNVEFISGDSIDPVIDDRIG
jgi:hypothetical protein